MEGKDICHSRHTISFIIQRNEFQIGLLIRGARVFLRIKVK